jgi:integrase
MALSDAQLRSAKPREARYKLADGHGLTVIITPEGGKWWRFRYRFDGAEKMLSFGTYPTVSIKEARQRRDAARKVLDAGRDPSRQRTQERKQRQIERANTFEAVALEWFALKESTWAEGHKIKIRYYLDRDLIPSLGDRPIGEIGRPELVDAVRQLEERQAFNAAKKARGWLGQIFRYALAKGLININPATDLDIVAAPAPRSVPHASLPVVELPALLRAVDMDGGSPLTRYAIRLLLLTGVRPGELRKAPWSEFDLERAVWSIPAERMKMRRPHLVPLPSQAVEILRQLQAISSRSALVFPGKDDPRRPMSENTINQTFRRLGYGGKQTGHGFRHLISTTLNEQGYNRDWVERQLAHGDEDAIRDVYNQADYLEPRREMMQRWADYISTLTG